MNTTIYILNGNSLANDCTQILGAYSSLEEAKGALLVYTNDTEKEGENFHNYFIDVRELNANAEEPENEILF